MWSFRSNRLLEPVDITVVNLIATLGRYQGRQELYRHQVPQMLETLRQVAVVESAEASNRIEGIVVQPHRLRALMDQAAPQTRSKVRSPATAMCWRASTPARSNCRSPPKRSAPCTPLCTLTYPVRVGTGSSATM